MKNIVFEISAASLGRLALNTARRFIYPFAPALSRGLGVPLSSIASIIAINQASGLLALFIGPVTDRLGYKFMMMVALGRALDGQNPARGYRRPLTEVTHFETYSGQSFK